MARTEEQLVKAEREANSRLNKAREAEASAQWGTEAKRKAHEEATAALNTLYRIESERHSPENFEPEVQVIGPSGVVEVMHRSRAQRLASEFPYLEIRHLRRMRHDHRGRTQGDDRRG
jgi:hypothetical protein